MQCHGEISLFCEHTKVSILLISTESAIDTWKIRQMRADTHDIAEHILKGSVRGFNSEWRSTRAFYLKTGDSLAALLVDVILDGESVGLDDLFAVFGVGVNIDL